MRWAVTMAGKDGSTWHHNYVPTNAAAAALKAHKSPGGKSTAHNSFLPVPASFRAPKGSGPKKPTAKTPAAPKAKRAATVKAKPKAAAKAKPKAKPSVDLSTREARAKAVAGADLSTPSGRALVARAQRASLASTKISHVPAAAITEQRLMEAAQGLASGHDKNRVSIADLRDAATSSGIPQSDVDSTLTAMFKAQKINLVPQSNQRALTPRQRQAAVRIGGESKHLIYLKPNKA